jgi:hypothetical protein
MVPRWRSIPCGASGTSLPRTSRRGPIVGTQSRTRATAVCSDAAPRPNRIEDLVGGSPASAARPIVSARARGATRYRNTRTHCVMIEIARAAALMGSRMAYPLPAAAATAFPRAKSCRLAHARGTASFCNSSRAGPSARKTADALRAQQCRGLRPGKISIPSITMSLEQFQNCYSRRSGGSRADCVSSGNIATTL